MGISTIVRLGALGLATAATIPNNNGFPNPNQQQMMQIAEAAGGMAPNTPPPKGLKDTSISTFQLLATNEIFETAYFNSLIQNITSGAAGYEAENKDELVQIFTRIRAQEETHALAIHGILETNGAFAPSACKYKFPVTNLKDAINVAETFTAIVLGALQGANAVLAGDEKAVPLVQLLSSAIGQEGEQNGYFRVYLKETPSESPFLTFVPGAIAYSALQMFIEPGSCPYDPSKINFAIFPPMMTNRGPIAALEPKDQTLSFSVDLSKSKDAQQYINTAGKGLTLTYMSGQHTPISVDIQGVKWCGSEMQFQAPFPYSMYVMRGLSVGVLTVGKGFMTSDDVVKATLAAPAIIQVSDSLQK